MCCCEFLWWFLGTNEFRRLDKPCKLLFGDIVPPCLCCALAFFILCVSLLSTVTWKSSLAFFSPRVCVWSNFSVPDVSLYRGSASILKVYCSLDSSWSVSLLLSRWSSSETLVASSFWSALGKSDSEGFISLIEETRTSSCLDLWTKSFGWNRSSALLCLTSPPIVLLAVRPSSESSSESIVVSCPVDAVLPTDCRCSELDSGGRRWERERLGISVMLLSCDRCSGENEANLSISGDCLTLLSLRHCVFSSVRSNESLFDESTPLFAWISLLPRTLFSALGASSVQAIFMEDLCRS